MTTTGNVERMGAWAELYLILHHVHPTRFKLRHPSMKPVIFLLFTCFFSSVALADDLDPRTTPSHYFAGFFGKSQIIFGSEDGRFGGGVSYAFGKPEKRFQMGEIPAQLVYEGYVDHTQSDGGSGFPANSTFAVGGLAYARWRWQVDKFGNGVYYDLGWGLQAASEVTLDLESTVNSTPVMDFGGVYREGHREYMIGLRYLHISNAGIVRPNYGQNEVFLTIGCRY